MKTKRAVTEIDKEIGRRLRARRTILGIGQVQLAGELGVTFQQVQKYEVGKNRISHSMAIKAAKVLGVSIGYFSDCEDVPVSVDKKGVMTHFKMYDKLSDNNRYAVDQLTRILLNGQEDVSK